MLTFEQSKSVKPLCKIIGGKYNNKVISIDPNINDADYVTTLKKLEIGNSSKLQMIPDTNHERDVYYITGPSGSGKSYFVRMYCEQYKKKFKNNEIYLFSNLKEDVSLDSVKPKRGLGSMMNYIMTRSRLMSLLTLLSFSMIQTVLAIEKFRMLYVQF